MDRIAIPAANAVGAAVMNASRPRRRWSDGRNYPYPDEAETSLAAQWPVVAALLCEHVASGTSKIHKEMGRLVADGRLSQHDASGVAGSAEAMRFASQAVQQIVRLGAGTVQPARERIDLTSLARQTVQERQAELFRRRCEVHIDIRPVEVLIDSAVAAGLMNSALDWALSFSSKVLLKIEQAAADRPVRLSVRGTLRHLPPSADAPAAPTRRDRRIDNLHWILLRQLAAIGKLEVGRIATADTESAVIGFPKSFFSADGLASVELLAGAESDPQLHDAWVLAVVRDRGLRETVLRLMLQNGLEASVAENCDHARQLCALRKPKVLVGCFETPGASALRRELSDSGERCAFVQIVRESPSFHASGFAGHDFVKVGRRELAKELIPALLFELAQLG